MNLDEILQGCQKIGDECEFWKNITIKDATCNFCQTDFCNTGNRPRLEKVIVTLLLISVVFV